MQILRHKNFKKQYKKLPKPLKLKVDQTLVKFVDDPFAENLQNHALKGRLKGKRAIYIGADLRMIFEEFDGYAIVLMLAVGSHNQVY